VSLARRALQGALWNALENVGSQLTSFVLFLAFARLISPAAIGVVQIVVTLLGFLTIFVEHGFTTRIIRTPVSTPAMLSTAFWLGLGGACAMAIVLTLASSRIAAWYRTPEVGPVLRTLAWTVPVVTLSCVQTALLLRDLAFRTQALRRLIAVVGGGVVGIGLAFSGFGIWSLVARFVTECVLDCIVAWSWTSWRPAFLVSRSEAKAFVSFGSRIAGSYAVNFLSRRADELLIGFVLGSVSLGYYAVAARAMTLVSEVALRAAQRTAVPVLSRLQNEPHRLRLAYCSALEFGAAVACPVFLGLSAVAPELCVTLYGSHWQPVIPAMQILGFAGAAMSLAIYTGPLLIAVGRPDWFLRFSLVETAINLVAAAIVVKYGIVAVAIAYVVRSYLIVPLILVMTSRVVGAAWFELLRLITAPTVASLLMFGATFYLRRSLALPPWLMLIILVTAGASVYLAGMWMFGRSTLHRIFAMVQSVRSKAPVVVPTREHGEEI
jgi:O-antigen/teichoic acid export membrane protein